MICIPWEALCVDLIGPYTLKGKDGSSIDFMALTMIDPASSWLEVVELPTITRVMTKKVNGKERTTFYPMLAALPRVEQELLRDSEELPTSF